MQIYLVAAVVVLFYAAEHANQFVLVVLGLVLADQVLVAGRGHHEPLHLGDVGRLNGLLVFGVFLFHLRKKDSF